MNLNVSLSRDVSVGDQLQLFLPHFICDSLIYKDAILTFLSFGQQTQNRRSENVPNFFSFKKVFFHNYLIILIKYFTNYNYNGITNEV